MGVTPSHVTIVPVVLAAGRGRRLGASTAKANVRLGRSTFLGHILTRLARCDTARPIVVLGAQADLVRHTHSNHDVDWVDNTRWASSQMFDSIVLAFEAMVERDGPRAALVWPVDCPLVSTDTVSALLGVDGGDVVVPTRGARRGHPVRLSRSAVDDVLARRGDSLRDLFAHWEVVELDVDDDAVLDNINTPEVLARVEARTGRHETR